MNIGFGISHVVFFYAIFLFFTNVVCAQDPPLGKSGVISINSSQEVPLEAERLRLSMLVKAESRDGKLALQSIYSHQNRVEKELKSLGAVAGSIEFSKPSILVGVPGIDDLEATKKRIRQQSAQMRNLNAVARGRNAASDIDDDAELPTVYTASSKVSAEWILSKNESDANILLPSTIRTAIDKNDLRGRELKVALSEDEQRVIAPLLGGVNVYSNESRVLDLQMAYVGRMSESQEAEAISEAFKKAEKQAASLAQIMGKRVIGVRNVTMSALQTLSMGRSYEYGPNGQLTPSNPRKDPREAVNEDLNLLRQMIAISLQFETE